MIRLKLLFFATLRDFMGTREMAFDVPDGTTVSQLKQLLTERFANAGPTLQSALISINKEFAFDADVLPDGAEVAIFPPVSGG